MGLSHSCLALQPNGSSETIFLAKRKQTSRASVNPGIREGGLLKGSTASSNRERTLSLGVGVPTIARDTTNNTFQQVIWKLRENGNWHCLGALQHRFENQTPALPQAKSAMRASPGDGQRAGGRAPPPQGHRVAGIIKSRKSFTEHSFAPLLVLSSRR